MSSAVEEDTTDYGGSEDSISDDKPLDINSNAGSKDWNDDDDIATEDPLYES